MLAVKIAILIGLFVYKTQHYPRWQYQHLLVDYHFGFTKRALIGALASFAFPKVPLWAVFAIGGGVWLATLGLFVATFRRMFGFDARYLPLFVFMAASPFFFANFMQNIGYTDIYGCAFALVFLLLPARSFWYVVSACIGGMVLILVHHIQTLMYVPTIGAIVIARYYLAQPRRPSQIVAGILLTLPVAALLIIAQFAGSPAVPQTEFEAHMFSRMAGPTYTIDANIWYQGARDELGGTGRVLKSNLLRIPIYLLILAAHLPLIAYFRRLVGALDAALHRHLAWLAVVLISFAYLMIFVFVSDYSRWVSNWTVCMMLLIFAIRNLPASLPVAPVADNAGTRRLGWIVTALPRIGTTIPF